MKFRDFAVELRARKVLQLERCWRSTLVSGFFRTGILDFYAAVEAAAFARVKLVADVLSTSEGEWVPWSFATFR